jgi:hypothetical protein
VSISDISVRDVSIFHNTIHIRSKVIEAAVRLIHILETARYKYCI